MGTFLGQLQHSSALQLITECCTKLTYLRSQLHGSAAKVISGLTLASLSYEHSIALLKDRFGQEKPPMRRLPRVFYT